jgi:hypothetical protein
VTFVFDLYYLFPLLPLFLRNGYIYDYFVTMFIWLILGLHHENGTTFPNVGCYNFALNQFSYFDQVF